MWTLGRPDPAVVAFGDSAVLVQLDGSAAARTLGESLRTDPPAGVTGAVPALQSVLVEFDPVVTHADDVARAAVGRASASVVAAPGRLRTVPVVYGGEHGPDLAAVADLTGLTAAAVVEIHASTELGVLFDGFAPGFAYLGELHEALRVPRLETPRTRTPRGSVAVAGAMSGVYPADLPGGWRVIGRTPIHLFDPLRDPPAYLLPGDRVRFLPIRADEWERHAGPGEDW